MPEVPLEACFISIPVERGVKGMYGQLVSDIAGVVGGFDGGSKAHITVGLMGSQPEKVIMEVAETVRGCTDVLHGCVLKISGLMAFYSRRDNICPRVLALSVGDPLGKLSYFRELLVGELGDLLTDTGAKFVPHVTLGRLPNLRAQTDFLSNRARVTAMVNGISANMSVSKVQVIGRYPNADGPPYIAARKISVHRRGPSYHEDGGFGDFYRRRSS